MVLPKFLKYPAAFGLSFGVFHLLAFDNPVSEAIDSAFDQIAFYPFRFIPRPPRQSVFNDFNLPPPPQGHGDMAARALRLKEGRAERLKQHRERLESLGFDYMRFVYPSRRPRAYADHLYKLQMERYNKFGGLFWETYQSNYVKAMLYPPFDASVLGVPIAPPDVDPELDNFRFEEKWD